MRPKVMLVCGFGLGTSQILKITLDAVLREEGVPADTFCSDESTARGQHYDMVITSAQFAGLFKDGVQPIVVVNNFLSREEVRKQCVGVIQGLAARR